MTKDEALKKAIWMLETIDKGERVYETRMIAETIHDCQEALEEQDKFVLICKHCGDELGIEYEN